MAICKDVEAWEMIINKSPDKSPDLICTINREGYIIEQTKPVRRLADMSVGKLQVDTSVNLYIQRVCFTP